MYNSHAKYVYSTYSCTATVMTNTKVKQETIMECKCHIPELELSLNLKGRGILRLHIKEIMCKAVAN